jgi:hypothetical protein
VSFTAPCRANLARRSSSGPTTRQQAARSPEQVLARLDAAKALPGAVLLLTRDRGRVVYRAMSPELWVYFLSFFLFVVLVRRALRSALGPDHSSTSRNAGILPMMGISVSAASCVGDRPRFFFFCASLSV